MNSTLHQLLPAALDAGLLTRRHGPEDLKLWLDQGSGEHHAGMQGSTAALAAALREAGMGEGQLHVHMDAGARRSCRGTLYYVFLYMSSLPVHPPDECCPPHLLIHLLIHLNRPVPIGYLARLLLNT